MLMMSVSSVTKTYYEAKILDGVSMEVIKGERIGLLGTNGSGKTTLMEMMAGNRTMDKGSISRAKGCRVGYLPQIPASYPGLSAGDVVMRALSELEKVREKMLVLEGEMANGSDTGAFHESLGLLETYGKLQSQFELMGGYAVDEKVARIRTALKIDDLLWEKPYELLSGGEKTRVALGSILMDAPDLLLMDEPTNHLDVEMIEWLETYLSTYEGAVVIISHDRYFLDNVVDRIVEIQNGQLELYEGNYSLYTVEKQNRYDLQVKHYHNQQKKIRAMEAAVKRFREWGRIADNEAMFVKANQMQRRLEKMDKLDRPNDGKLKFEFDFAEQNKSSKKVVVGRGMSKSFGEQRILNRQDFEVERRERVALVGRNGSGKTTLFKILMGLTELDEGTLRLGEGITPIWLEQEVAFPNPKASILEYYREEAMVEEGRARHILAGFGFRGAEVFRSVGSLSGGERSRLRLLILTGTEANLLMLDEPTNHLDIATKEKLEENMGEFGGTVFFISHDRYFINMVADRIIELDQGQLRSYSGNYDDYKEAKVCKQTVAVAPPREVTPPKEAVISTPKSKPINKFALEKLECEIERFENRKSVLKLEIEANASDYTRLDAMLKELESVEIEIDRLLSEWEERQSPC